MTHKYAIGAAVRFETAYPSQTGTYTVVRQMPIERDNVVKYRIKSAVENFERTVDEYQLTPLA